MTLPLWHLAGEPLGLAKYVFPKHVKQYLNLPGPSTEDPIHRLAEVYAAMRAARINYALEGRAPGGWQQIRSPHDVLAAPHHGTCLDLALTLSGACLVAGLHPMIIIVDPKDHGAAHALLAVWLDADDGAHPLDETPGWWVERPAQLSALVQTELDGPPRSIVLVDPVGVCVAAPSSSVDLDVELSQAVRRGGEYILSSEWSWRMAVDIGSVWNEQAVLPLDISASAGRRGSAGHGVGWVYRGGQEKSHFVQHSNGRRHRTWSDDWYVGRDAALGRILGHCAQASESRTPLVIVGQPGSGKSTVLSRAVARLEAEGVVGVAVHGRDSPLRDIVAGVAEACGLDVSTDIELMQELATADRVQVVVAVDALDEMRTSQDRDEAATLLAELATLAGVKVIVATRPLTGGDYGGRSGWQRSTLLRRLMSGQPNLSSIVDLDSDHYFDERDLDHLVEMVLMKSPVRSQSLHGGSARAADVYRVDEQLRRGLAAEIRQQSERNYLVAAMMASLLADSTTALDPRQSDFDPAALPNGVGEIVDKLLASVSDIGREQVRGLLTALAYARGSGLTDARAIRFASSLGFGPISSNAMEQLRGSAAADLLDDSYKDGRHLTRLFHRALVDHLRTERSTASDERKLCDLMVSEAAEDGWSDGYIRRFLPAHVLGADRAEEFLRSPEFITRCFPSSLSPVAAATPIDDASSPASVLRLALPKLSDNGTENPLGIELAARVQGAADLADGIRRVSPAGLVEIECVEATPRRVPYCVFTQHVAAVRGACVVDCRTRNRLHMATVGLDGTARVWDPYAPGTPELARFAGHTDHVNAVAALPWPGYDDPVLVTASDDGTARVWDPRGLAAELACFRGHRGRVRSVHRYDAGERGVACMTTADDATVQIWQEDVGELVVTAVYDGHAGEVLTAVQLPGDLGGLVASGSSDAAVHTWHPAACAPAAPDDTRHAGRVRSAIFLDHPEHDHPLLITTSNDATARLWRIDSSSAIPQGRFAEHGDWVRDICLLPWPGRNLVAATASGDTTIRIWDPSRLAEGNLVVLDAHRAPVRSVECIEFPGSPVPVLLSASADRTVRILDPYARREILRIDHPDIVRRAIEIPTGDPKRTVVTAAAGDRVYVWDLTEEHTRSLAVFDHHTDWVRDLAVLSLPDGPRVCSVSNDATVRVWDPFDGDWAESVGLDHSDWIWGITTIRTESDDLIATTSADGWLRIWRFDGEQLIELDAILLGMTGLSANSWQDRLVVTTDRGFVVFRLSEGLRRLSGSELF